MQKRLLAVGDVHGDYPRLRRLLYDAHLVDGIGDWIGGESTLVFTGDLTDRGNYGLETIEFVRQLQRQAEDAGGVVESLLGNHDAMLLTCVYELREDYPDQDILDVFQMNGGKLLEARLLARDEPAEAWLAARPLMLAIDRTLFQHADSALFYRRLGESVEAVNDAGSRLVKSSQGAWTVFAEMTDGRDWDVAALRDRKAALAGLDDHLARFDADRVVHGHTRHLESAPLVYADGRAINIDGSLSEGYRRTPDRGFVADLDSVGYPSP